jgi:hypothetical protein
VTQHPAQVGRQHRWRHDARVARRPRAVGWLHAPGLRLGGSTDHGVGVAARAEVDLRPLAEGTWAVRQHGPYRLWDTIEHAVTAFDALGRPGACRLGVTARAMPGKQYVWLDDPDSDHCWPLGAPTD